MGKTLYLEKRGCNFWNDARIKEFSDVGNYRVGVYDYSIHGKDGNDYILEFGSYNKMKTRYESKTGKPLKHPKTEILLENALHVDTQHENEKGCWRNCKLELDLNEKNYTFTLENILKAVNDISADEYTAIDFINE